MVKMATALLCGIRMNMIVIHHGTPIVSISGLQMQEITGQILVPISSKARQ